MKDPLIVIDYEKCTGCRTCEIVCSTVNNGDVNPQKSRIRIVKIQDDMAHLSIPVVCMKCIKPFCKAVCPTGAISEDPSNGAMVTDPKKCIGCSACVYACPFGAIAVDRDMGISYTCKQCDGNPACVRFCPTNAIQYLEASEVNTKLCRAHIDKYTALAVASSE